LENAVFRYFIVFFHFLKDGSCSGISVLLLFIAGCVEAWYADCYKPIGVIYADACGIKAWIAAAVIF